MIRNCKRYALSFLMLCVVAVAVAPAMAAALFQADFTTGSATNSASTGGAIGIGYGVAPTFLDASDHGVAGTAGTIYGADYKTDYTDPTNGNNIGWAWTNPVAGGSPIDATTPDPLKPGNVFFVKESVVTDQYNALQTDPGRFNCDLLGTSGTDSVNLYPTLLMTNSPDEVRTPVLNTAGGFQILHQGSGIVVPAGPTSAQLKPLLDGVFTTTFVWRGATADGKTVTQEVSGNAGTWKGQNSASYAIMPTNFTGLSPTVFLTPLVTTGTVYSNVSGQEDGTNPTGNSKVRMGWAKFEVGQTKSTDFNFDYATTLADGQIWNAGRNNTSIPAGQATMSQGDANNDGAVTLADGQLWNAARNAGGTYDQTTPGNEVPTVTYYPNTGKLSILADSAPVTINSIIVSLKDNSAVFGCRSVDGPDQPAGPFQRRFGVGCPQGSSNAGLHRSHVRGRQPG